MITAINPFDDQEFKKQILEKEGKIEDAGIGESDLKSIITQAPKIPGEKKVGNLILDASAIAKNSNEQKALAVTTALNRVFTDYNKKYGLELNMNFNNLAETLVNVCDDKNRRILELYVSKVVRSARGILVLHLINRLMIAIDYITDPNRLFNNNEFTLADQFVAVNQLIGFISQLEDLKKDLIIEGDDLELEQLRQECEKGGVEYNKEAIESFNRLFNIEHGIK